MTKISKNHGVTYRIVPDPDPPSPAENDDPELFLAATHRQFSVKPRFKGEFGETHWEFPLYAYIHGGVTLSLNPYSCPFDSGRVGSVFVGKKEWPDESAAKKAADSLVAEWNTLLSGDVWGFEVVEDGVVVDSCWGYYGENAAREEAESAVESAVERKQAAEKLILC